MEEKRKWDRKAIKKRGKERFFANYWSSVLVAFVVLVISGGITLSITPFTGAETARNIIRIRQYSDMTDYFEDMYGCDDVECVEDGDHGFSISQGDDQVNISIGSDGINIRAHDGDDGVDVSIGNSGIQVSGSDGDDGIDVSVGNSGIQVSGSDGQDGVSVNVPGTSISDGTIGGLAISWAAIGTFIAAMALLYILVLLVYAALDILVFEPLKVGGKKFFVNNLDLKESPKLLGAMFKNGQYGRTVGTMFLKNLFTFLWALLFIVPGIIKAYEYRMIPYLLADRPEMTRKEMFEKSREMMYGYKWKAFVFDLSYIGWGILNLLTFNLLGIFYVFPYKYQANAALYEFLCSRGQTEEHYENYIEVQ